jgi:N-acetylmuramic acid 6-phosphate etherase
MNNLDLNNLTTEAPSKYLDLDQKSINELLLGINKEDQSVSLAVAKVIPQIEKLISAICVKMKNGGRLFYIGAGTSGRLGILDASECPPTYGVSTDLIQGLIAGGDKAIRQAVENAEDDPKQAWEDLQKLGINNKDSLIGIAASGRTPYVLGGLLDAHKNGVLTACIVCNINSPISKSCQFPVEVEVGPEFVTGSTRMKAGTAQKLILNMISTTLMIQLGKVKGNKMVDMQLSNSKLVERAVQMLVTELKIERQHAEELLTKFGSVRKAIEHYNSNKDV